MKPSVAWLYLLAGGFSTLGNAVANVVWPWLVLQRTGDPAAAGFVAAAIGIPALIFAFLGGQLVDMFGRKKMSIISDVVSAVSVVSIIGVNAVTELNVAWFIALGIFGALGDIPGLAARNALLGDVAIVSGRTVDWLSGAMQAVFGGMFLVGPALAGVLIAALPVTNVLWITAGCSFAAAVVTVMMRLPTGSQSATVDDLRSGLQVWGRLLADTQIRMLAVVAVFAQVLVIPFVTVLLPAQFHDINQPAYLGFALSGYAIGLIIGGGVIAIVGTAHRRMIWTVTMLLFVVAAFLIVNLSVALLVILGMMVAGVAGGLQGAIQTVVITENIIDELRGRAFALFNAVYLFAGPIGLTLTTIALHSVTIYQVAAVCGVLFICVSVWSIFQGRRAFQS